MQNTTKHPVDAQLYPQPSFADNAAANPNLRSLARMNMAMLSRSSRVSLATILSLTCGAIGCQQESPPLSQTALAPASVAANADGPLKSASSADEIVSRMQEAYRQAASYADRGRIVLRFRERGDIREDAASLAVAARKPSCVHVEAYHAVLVCDGKRLMARVQDELSHDLDGQILARPLEGELTLDQCYRDAVLREAMTRGLGGEPPQLSLLFGQQPRSGILGEGVRLRLLPPEKFESQPCLRVASDTAQGTFVLWIDQQHFLLRRLDYPAERIVPDLATSADVRDLQLFAEFREARWTPAPDASSFHFEVPPDAKQVQALVLPPHPLPSKLFGQPAGDFALHQPDGRKLRRDDLRGQIAVLLWFNNHPACRITLEQLNAVYAELPPEHGVRMLAVSTEPSSVANAQLESVLRDWNIGVPWVRDLQAFGRDVFHIPWAPTLIVLDGEGTVQIFEVGANPNLARELPVILDRLRQGHDLAAEIVAAHEQEKVEYQRLLEIATQAGDGRAVELALAKIRPRSEPRRFQLQWAWKSAPLTRPGNIVALRDDQELLSLVVLEGGTVATELTADGRLSARHDVQPEGAPATRLLTATDSQSQRFYLVAATTARSVDLFDQSWRRALRYPPPEAEHAGIVATELGDLNGDGQLEMLLGFAGPQGVECVAKDGTSLWTNPSVSRVLSLALSTDPANKTLLVTSERGDLAQFDAAGEPLATLKVEGKNIFHLFTAEEENTATPYCGLTYSEAGNLVAIGLDADFQEVWNYPLPPGTFHYPTQFVTGGRIGEHAYWCLAAPDGTIHFIRADGHVSDNFAFGEEVRGFQLVAGLLVVSTRASVEAWRISEMSAPQPGRGAPPPAGGTP